jgi:type III secretory pathway component EscS
METDFIVVLLQQALMLLLVVAAPTVLTAAGVGLIVAILQSTTQIQDQSISQSLKMAAVVIVLAVAGTWMGASIKDFALRVFREFPSMVHKTTTSTKEIK